MHEHVMVDFVGAKKISPGRYDPNEVFQKALPHLKELKSLGCETLVDCTPNYIGRDPELLRRLSKATGLHIITNTGLYGAADDKYVPRFAYTESADELAARWVQESEDGIPPAGIRPGFMKIGVDSGPLSVIDAKLVTAAARTHAPPHGLSHRGPHGRRHGSASRVERAEEGRRSPLRFYLGSRPERIRRRHSPAGG